MIGSAVTLKSAVRRVTFTDSGVESLLFSPANSSTWLKTSVWTKIRYCPLKWNGTANVAEFSYDPPALSKPKCVRVASLHVIAISYDVVDRSDHLVHPGTGNRVSGTVVDHGPPDCERTACFGDGVSRRSHSRGRRVE